MCAVNKGQGMKLFRLLPISLLLSLICIAAIPAIAYGSFRYIYQIDPDSIGSTYGPLKIDWQKFSENDSFTEYLGKDKYFDEESMRADILVMRTYQSTQTSIHENSKVIYRSVLMHQSVNCRNRTVSVQDLMMFSRAFTKGALVKDLYDLDWDLGEAKAGTIDEKKISTLCSFES